MNSITKILLALTTGVAVGILLAPDKGSNTRKKIKSKAGKLAEELKQTIDLAKDKCVDLKEDLI